MPFVTRLTLKSGDGSLLESVVDDLKVQAERKGVELRGPHPKPPRKFSVPLYKAGRGSGTFDPWKYTVYTRVVEIVGHDEFARTVTERSYPDRIHITADIEQFSQAGE